MFIVYTSVRVYYISAFWNRYCMRPSDVQVT